MASGFTLALCLEQVGPVAVSKGRTIRETKKPPWAGGSSAHTAGFSLPAHLEASSATRAGANGAASTVTVGDHLDPKCILVLEVRRVAGLAQRIQAALLRTRGCGGEPRQLEDCLLYTSDAADD